jgi:hypothetical protein
VRAFNEDMPYDEFVRKQFAADLLPNFQPPDVAALGFLGLSPSYWKELKLDHNVIKQVVAEEWEERIEAIGGVSTNEQSRETRVQSRGSARSAELWTLDSQLSTSHGSR